MTLYFLKMPVKFHRSPHGYIPKVEGTLNVLHVLTSRDSRKQNENICVCRIGNTWKLWKAVIEIPDKGCKADEVASIVYSFHIQTSSMSPNL
jgi:hypothetical protein